ncbi:MAG: glycosyltransferase, partial [Verrucomicrobiales bacterium]|nr:glycosyltransferase [Verrucomicrobiales bacterium]
EVVEVIVVDGGSTDSTHQLAVSCGAKVLSSPPGRGLQLRLGAEAARGDIIWMVHADMEIPPHSAQAILRSFRDSRVVAGGFWKTFQERRLLLFGSRIRCFIRLVLFRRLMADQAIFVSRQALVNIGGVPPMPLMEEFELCRLLRRQGLLCLAGATVKTSARRFLKHGIITTYATMASVTLRYFLGESPENLKKLYEKK